MRDAPSTASRLPLPLARLVQFLYASLCVTFSCCRYFYDFYSPDIFTVPPLSVHHPPLPLCLYCTLLVVLSHSFYVLFSATLLLCHFTFVTLPSPHPPSAAAFLLILSILCVWLPCGAVLVHILCAFICRAQLTLIGCIRRIVPPPFPLPCLVCLPPFLPPLYVF